MEMTQKEEELVPEYDQMEQAEEVPGGALEEKSSEVEEAEGEKKDAFSFSDGGSVSQSEAETGQPVEPSMSDHHGASG